LALSPRNRVEEVGFDRQVEQLTDLIHGGASGITYDLTDIFHSG